MRFGWLTLSLSPAPEEDAARIDQQLEQVCFAEQLGFDDVRRSHVTLFRWPGPDGRRPSEVAADAQISKQRVNDLLRELEELGYLRLEPDHVDSRARVIRLSERGRRLHKTALGIHTAIEEEWAKAVGAQRFRQLRRVLADLVAQLGGRMEETV